MSDVVCYWLEPTDRCRLWLRRYSADTKCPGPMGYHNAMALFGEEDARYGATGSGGRYLGHFDDLAPPHDDPRWPTVCEGCGRAFLENEHWQVFQHQLYKRADNGEITTIEDAPPGAMWNAWWMGESERKSPDGIELMVKLPNGSEWWVDGPSRDGGHWTRTGTVPKVTASPSIFADQGGPKEYHGWLRNGVLTRC